MVVLMCMSSTLGNDMYGNDVMSKDAWYGLTLMFRLRYYWNNVISNATYNVIVIIIGLV